MKFTILIHISERSVFPGPPLTVSVAGGSGREVKRTVRVQVQGQGWKRMQT